MKHKSASLFVSKSTEFLLIKVNAFRFSMQGALPIIDISPLLQNSPDRTAVTKEIHEACKTFGFFYIKNHGVNPSLEKQLEHAFRTFFSLPVDQKNKVSMKFGGPAWRGYFPLGDELTGGRPDVKEGFTFGPELPPTHSLVRAKVPLHGPNLFPDSVPALKPTVLRWTAEMTLLGHVLMQAIATGLNLPKNYFEKWFQPEPSFLFRAFHYPGKSNEAAQRFPNDSWGVAEHTDYGFIIILKQDSVGGLEVKSRDGSWIPAPPIPGTFIVNIGDMLEKVTGGLYRSTPHRVKCPPLDRMSFPFFFDPNFHAKLEPIEQLKGLARPEEDKVTRWDGSSVHELDGIYGDYLVSKVSRVFPALAQQVLL